MPTRFCTGTSLCGNHRPEAKEEEIHTDCKDFVIIGNGPSGIVLSYLLSGHWPYYMGESQDQFLHSRLSVQPELSLVEQDLQFLSDGLEGRSNNPVSLLLDALQKPDADLGIEMSSLLDWKAVEDGKVNHVVLGRGKPGGVWQTLDGGLLTVSLGGWMELPNLTMADWKTSSKFRGTATENNSRRTSVDSVCKYYSDYVDLMGLSDNFEDNTIVTSVKQVKCDKTSVSCLEDSEVKCFARMESIPEKEIGVEGSEDIFRFDIEELESSEISSQCSSMTGLHRRSLSSISVDSSCPTASLPSPYDRLRVSAQEPMCSLQCQYESDFLSSWDPILNPSLFGSYKSSVPPSGTSISAYSASLGSSSLRQRPRVCSSEECEKTMFEVSGYKRGKGGKTQPFKYLSKNVVLATGQFDDPNKLGVPGEELPFVLHSLAELESAVKAGKITTNSDPVLVVGAGLSAADAILNTQAHGFPTAHIFRKSVTDPQLIFNKLPSALYPEYHKVHSWMAGGRLDEVRILKIEKEHPGYKAWSETEVMKIESTRRVTLRGPTSQETIQVSYVLVLIGAAPNLDFMTQSGEELGRFPGQPVDKNNPIDIDVFSHQSVKVPGLFAMGPLTGDNFVRFLQGGALAVANHIHHQKKGKSREDEM